MKIYIKVSEESSDIVVFSSCCGATSQKPLIATIPEAAAESTDEFTARGCLPKYSVIPNRPPGQISIYISVLVPFLEWLKNIAFM